MSLTTRLVALILAALLPVLAIQAANTSVLQAEQEREVGAAVRRQAEFLAGDLTQLVDGIRQVQAALAEMPQITGGVREACTPVIQGVVARQPVYRNVLVADADGMVWCNALLRDTFEPYSIAHRDYFKGSKAGEAFAVGVFTRGMTTGADVLHFATPIRDGDGTFAGVVVTALDLTWLAQRLERPDWSEGRAVLVADREGTVLVRHPDNTTFAGRTVPDPLLALLGQAAPGVVDTEGTVDGVRRVIGYVPPGANPYGLYVGVGLSHEAAFGALRAAGERQLVLTLAVAALAALAAWMIAERGVRRPVRTLLAAAARWRKGDLSSRSGVGGSSELGQLGAAFDGLAAGLEAELARKDTLLRELAHRTMNNLQVLGAILALQAKGVSDGEARHELGEATSRVQAMALAYRSLHGSGTGGLVDLGHVLRELCANMAAAVMTGGCKVEAPPLLLSSELAMPLALIANELVTNAAKHGGGGPVEVWLGPDGAGWRLAVRNRGTLPPGFDPARADGFGLRMVVAMAGQVGGRTSFHDGDGWTECAVIFTPEVSEKVA